eukprot:480957-Amphidinium_carterae.1
MKKASLQLSYLIGICQIVVSNRFSETLPNNPCDVKCYSSILLVNKRKRLVRMHACSHTHAYYFANPIELADLFCKSGGLRLGEQWCERILAPPDGCAMHTPIYLCHPFHS